MFTGRHRGRIDSQAGLDRLIGQDGRHEIDGAIAT
jgi:hypothetical protein